MYLMTTSQYENYDSPTIECMGIDSNAGSNVKASVRMNSFLKYLLNAFDVTGWKTYRDVHAYENTDSVVMSITMDGPEVYSSLFSDMTYQEFFIVVDAWDNSRRGDAGVQNKILVADVAISTVERSVVLPNWTVSIAFFVFFRGS